MADLVEINISVVDKGNNLEKAVTKTQALQSKLKRLAKEIDNGAVSDSKRSQTLIALGRELKKVSDYTGTQAYGQVKKYFNAQVKSIAADKKAAEYKKRLARVQDYLTERTKRGTASIKKFENTSRKGMRNFELIAQQAGYQFGDLAVQIQGGTNAAVAFGQQGSQLLGFFGPAGAIAGAGLAIATGLIAPFIRAKKESEGLEKALEDVGSEISTIISQREMLEKALSTPFINGIAHLTEFFDKLNFEREKAARIALRQGLGLSRGDEGILPMLQSELDKINLKIKVNSRVQGAKYKLGEEFKEATEKAQALEKAIFDIGSTLLGAEAESKSLTENIEDLVKVSQEYGGTIESQITDLIKSAGLESELQKILEGRVESQKDLNGGITEELSEADKLFKKRRASMDEQIALLEYEVALRENYTDQSYIQERLEINKLELFIEQNKLNDTQANALRSQLFFLLDQKDALKDITEEQREQLRLAKLSEEAFGITYGLMEGSAAAKSLKKYGGRGTVSDKDPTFGSTGESIYKDSRKSKSESMSSIIRNLTEEANLEQRLVGISKEQAYYQEILFDLTEKNKTASGKLSEEQIKAEAEKLAAIKKTTNELQAQVDQQDALGDLISSHFEDFFMSIVDGTANVGDAFKSMASEVIKELYRIFVVKKITGMIEGAIGGYFGVPSADGGGYTGNAPRSGGLDGKGGFMAMLHPRETVVDHTKGQSLGGDSVVVHQNFNFSANGDDSVKKLIAQAAPQIAKMTESSIMDSRRRGGKMKAAFG